MLLFVTSVSFCKIFFVSFVIFCELFELFVPTSARDVLLRHFVASQIDCIIEDARVPVEIRRAHNRATEYKTFLELQKVM
jgi:hypothetical protein